MKEEQMLVNYCLQVFQILLLVLTSWWIPVPWKVLGIVDQDPSLWSGNTGGWLQMNRLSLRNNQLKFKTPGKLPILSEEYIEYIQFNIAKPEDVNM